MEEVTKKPKYRKVFIQFEGDDYDVYDIKRITQVEESDTQLPDGIKYGLQILVNTFTNENKTYWFKTKKIRNEKKELLEVRIQLGNILIIK